MYSMGAIKYAFHSLIPTKSSRRIASLEMEKRRIQIEKGDIKEWKQSLKEEKATFNRKKRIKILNDSIKQAEYNIKNSQATIIFTQKQNKKQKISKSKKYWE